MLFISEHAGTIQKNILTSDFDWVISNQNDDRF